MPLEEVYINLISVSIHNLSFYPLLKILQCKRYIRCFCTFTELLIIATSWVGKDKIVCKYKI